MATAPDTSGPRSAEQILADRMPRIDSLTGLRWWAAFFVFAYHMLVFAPLPPQASAFLHYGFFGVTFFFVLSGFVLTWSASSRVSQSTFYWRRFARIYPSHLVALLLAIPVFYSFAPDPDQSWIKPVSVGILALSFVLLQGWSTNPDILFSGNPAAWTLTCEAFFYALHPFVGKIFRAVRLRGALVLVIGTMAVAFGYRGLALVLPGHWLTNLPLPLVHLPEFVLGMGLAWAFRCGWRPRVPIALGVGALLLCLAALVFVPRLAPGSIVDTLVGTFSNELFTVACALAIIAFAGGTLAGRRSIFASRVMVRLGEWSYAFYLVHATVIYLALNLLGRQAPSWSNLGWFALMLAGGLVLSAGLHHFVEKPVERGMRAWKDDRDQRRAAATAAPVEAS